MATKTLADSPMWSYLTNHAFVLLCLFRNPDVRLREVALTVGVTERAVQRIVSELEADGVLTRTRVGRRNTYTIAMDSPFRCGLVKDRTVGELLQFLGK